MRIHFNPYESVQIRNLCIFLHFNNYYYLYQKVSKMQKGYCH